MALANLQYAVWCLEYLATTDELSRISRIEGKHIIVVRHHT